MTSPRHDRWIEAMVRDGFETGGFMGMLSTYLYDEPWLSLKPDAWRLRKGAEAAEYKMAPHVTIIEAVEVEGAAPLNHKRILKWMGLWQAVDGSDDAELVLYGVCASSGGVRRIDLVRVYLDSLRLTESDSLRVTLPVGRYG